MTPSVTIVVSPRERFSRAVRSLESVCAHTPPAVPMIYADGGSPPATLQAIESIAAGRGIDLIRTDRYLNPNEARNRGIARVRTPYVAFVDNDVIVEPGWLETLVRCAEETGAWLVEPLIFEGEPGSDLIHVAGGDIRFIEQDGRRLMRDTYRYARTRLADAASDLRRAPTGFVEFHCMLARREALTRLGPLDEALTVHEELDLALLVREAGGTMYFEPACRVSYLNDGPFEEGDYPYFFLRWSDGWNDASHRHFYEKWKISMDDPDFARHLGWLQEHRSRILKDDPAALRWFLQAGDGTSSGLS